LTSPGSTTYADLMDATGDEFIGRDPELSLLEEAYAAAFDVGEYWDASTQVDVVGLRDDGWIDLGECKWGPVRSAAALASELEQKVTLYPNPRNATLARRLFTRDAAPARSARGAPGARWHTLADLYGASRAPAARRRRG
jgi:hypothetical protein